MAEAWIRMASGTESDRPERKSMNSSTEKKLMAALEICQSLPAWKCQKNHKTFDAIKLFCEVAKHPTEFLAFHQKYASKTQSALAALNEYGTSVDNWRVNWEIGFGVKDHCNILSFFLNVPTGKVTSFSGNLPTAEIISELIADWQGIDLTPLTKKPENISVA